MARTQTDGRRGGMTPWTVVLAAGAGRRLAEITGGVPKQYWRAEDGASLLRRTLDRFEPIAPSSRTVVVVDAAHRQYFTTGDAMAWASGFVRQPSDRGTATGVLLGLLPVLEHDPDAVVVLTPSDHGVLDERRFRQSVLDAASDVRARDSIVLFGVEPTAANSDYGWMTLGPAPAPGRPRPVIAFVEKPDRETAARLFAAGAVWNTMVTVARAGALRDLYADRLPELAGMFADALRQPRRERDAFLVATYPQMAARDFSRDVLTDAPGLFASVWPVTLGWSDLGTPDRFYASQGRIPSSSGAAGTARAVHAA